MPNEINVRIEDAVAVVRPTGELDLAREQELRSALERALASGADAVRVELAQVTFIDSTALSALVGARLEATHSGISLCVVEPAPNVRRVFDVTKLDWLLRDE